MKLVKHELEELATGKFSIHGTLRICYLNRRKSICHAKSTPWEPRFDKFTATHLLKYTLDQYSWSLEIREVDSITIIRGVL